MYFVLREAILGLAPLIAQPSCKTTMLLNPFRATLRRAGTCAFSTGSAIRWAGRPKIYTKTGDKGTSSLFTGERRPKDDEVFEALGTNDELSSFVGLAREYCLDQGPDVQGMVAQLEQIQCLLQDIGSNIATPRDSATAPRLARTEFDSDGQHVQDLENWIDSMDQELPPLTSFILPSGGKAAATLHVARSISRRTERRVVPLAQEQHVDQSVAIYLNRLSDYLFTCGRYAAMKAGRQEVLYKKPRAPRVKKTSSDENTSTEN